VEKKVIRSLKKMFTYFKERVVRRGNLICPPQVMCEGDKRLLNAISH
jgi:hypothetical protein